MSSKSLNIIRSDLHDVTNGLEDLDQLRATVVNDRALLVEQLVEGRDELVERDAEVREALQQIPHLRKKILQNVPRSIVDPLQS
jgi:DUF1009 family protein